MQKPVLLFYFPNYFLGMTIDHDMCIFMTWAAPGQIWGESNMRWTFQKTKRRASRERSVIKESRKIWKDARRKRGGTENVTKKVWGFHTHALVFLNFFSEEDSACGSVHFFFRKFSK
jgi:hypothetical protein